MMRSGIKIFKKIVSFIYVFIIVCLWIPEANAQVDITAKSAIIIDASNGMTIYEQQADQRRYMASLTKIMTALIALEEGNPDEAITASENAVNSISLDSSKMDLKPGETYSLSEYLYGLIVHSANDAANVIAEHISGSVEAFVERMNQRAAEMGLKETHFTNAHGLHDINHYTTARDMAIIARVAMENPEFRVLAQTAEHMLPPTQQHPEERILTSTNQMLHEGNQYYSSHIKGIKTGFTSDAGQCLASAAEYEGITYIAIVLNSTNNFADTRKLYTYAREAYPAFTVVKEGDYLEQLPIKGAKGTREALLEAEKTIKAALPKDTQKMYITRTVNLINPVAKAPLPKGTVLGTADYFYNGYKVGTVNMVATRDYEYEPLSIILEPLREVLASKKFYMALVGLLLVLILLRMRAVRLGRRRRNRRKNNKFH